MAPTRNGSRRRQPDLDGRSTTAHLRNTDRLASVHPTGALSNPSPQVRRLLAMATKVPQARPWSHLAPLSPRVALDHAERGGQGVHRATGPPGPRSRLLCRAISREIRVGAVRSDGDHRTGQAWVITWEVFSRLASVWRLGDRRRCGVVAHASLPAPPDPVVSEHGELIMQVHGETGPSRSAMRGLPRDLVRTTTGGSSPCRFRPDIQRTLWPYC